MTKYKARFAYRDDESARMYERKRFHSIRGRLVDALEKRLIARALEKGRIVPPNSVLDLPCGTGRITLYLAGRGYVVTGADVSPSMILESEKKITGIKLTRTPAFCVEDAESLTFPDGSFDAVVSLRLFGHLPDTARKNILREMARVSRRAVIATYYLRGSLRNRLRRKTRSHDGVPWNAVNFDRIPDDAKNTGLVILHAYYLCPFVSETVVVLFKKADT